MNIGQKYRIVNHKIKELNGIIVKVIEYNNILNDYLCEIVDKSILYNYYPDIQYYFASNGKRWFSEDKLDQLRSDKLKRLLK